jgi:C4-dicarboxylate transporter DctM subunit
LTSSRQGFWALTTPGVIFAGIYGGVFSPTEAAAVTSAYCVLVACVIYRDVSWRDLVGIATTSVKTSGQILLLIAVSGLFSWLLTINGVANAIMEFARVNIVDTWAVLLGINVLLLVVGCFVDPISAILILTPLMVPIAQAFDINLIHLGVIVCLNLGIGMFHPPFGLNLFATQAALKVNLDDLYMGIIPFVGVALVALAIVTYVPWFSLALLK